MNVVVKKSLRKVAVFCMNPGCIINALTAFPITFSEEVLFSPWCPSGCHMISWLGRPNTGLTGSRVEP